MTTKTRKTAVRTKWERVGEVGVDSGQLMICDPANVDDQWIAGQEPAGHPVNILSAKGKEKFPSLKFSAKFPFTWGNYSSVCPELGMSMNDARVEGLLEEVDTDPLRDFSYRGACDVSHLKGHGFGQLHYEVGHAGAGVAFASGYGDGLYPVFARRNKEGRIVEVRILMGA